MQAGEAARPRTESQDVQSHDGTMPSGGKRTAGGKGKAEGTEAAPRRVRRGSELREKQESVESGTCTDSLCPGPPSRPPKGLGVKQSPSRFGADIITKGTCAQSQLEAGPRGTARSSHVHQVY